MLDQLKFLDLGSLHFEAGAFRSIRRSPRLLLIQNVSRIPALLPLAFAGLGRLQHFWWRNVSIGRVHARAFAKLWHIDYLYFHQTHIKVFYPILPKKYLYLSDLFLHFSELTPAVLAKFQALATFSSAIEFASTGWLTAHFQAVEWKNWCWRMFCSKDRPECLTDCRQNGCECSTAAGAEAEEGGRGGTKHQNQRKKMMDMGQGWRKCGQRDGEMRLIPSTSSSA